MAYERLNLKDGDTLTAEHIKHIEDALEATANITAVETITADSTYSNAEQVYNFIRSLMNDGDNVVGIVNTNRDTSSYANNQCIQAIVYKDLNNMSWVRWRDGSLSPNCSTNYQYDLTINAGDTFHKVVFE